MKVSVIIPAYNEASRIGAVLAPVLASELVNEVIVVDDGSEDGTADIARQFPVAVLCLPQNRGKAAALDEGVALAQHDDILFLDADLVGLRTEHVDSMIKTYRDQELDMVVGVFSGGRATTDIAQTINPFASGQRMIRRKLWQLAKDRVESSSTVEEMSFGVEIALSRMAVKEGWLKEKVKLDGVTHVLKEEKRGFSQGLRDRFRMYGDMIKWLVKKV